MLRRTSVTKTTRLEELTSSLDASTIVWPSSRVGWMRKCSRSGLIRNWQARYFVLNEGKLSYYRGEFSTPEQEAEFKKGELFLEDAWISTDRKNYLDNQLFVETGNKSIPGILLELDTSEEATEWKQSISLHIEYLSTLKSRITPSIPSTLSNIPGTPLPTSRRKSVQSSTDVPSDMISNLRSLEPVTITPRPNLVIKLLRHNGEKIFINLCDANEVPFVPPTIAFNKWPPMVVTPSRSVVDVRGDDGFSVYDAIVNSRVVEMYEEDPLMKDATCQRAIRSIIKLYGEKADVDYKLPKIQRKYKGELQTIRVPADFEDKLRSNSQIAITIVKEPSKSNSTDGSIPIPIIPNTNREPFLRRTSSSTHSSNTTTFLDHVGSAGSSGPDRTTTLLMKNSNNVESKSPPSGDSLMVPTKSTGEVIKSNNSNPSKAFLSRANSQPPLVANGNPSSGMYSSSSQSMNKKSTPSTTSQVKYQFSYQLVKEMGTVARVSPDRSSKGKILATGAKITACGLYESPNDHSIWIETNEGWILDRTLKLKYRQVIPLPLLNPKSVVIVGTQFHEPGALNSFANHLKKNGKGKSNNGPKIRFGYQKSVMKGGWFQRSPLSFPTVGEAFETWFTFDCHQLDGSNVRLTRSLTELQAFRLVLLRGDYQVHSTIQEIAHVVDNTPSPEFKTLSRTVTDSLFYGSTDDHNDMDVRKWVKELPDGSEELLDVHTLLFLRAEMEHWLGTFFTSVNVLQLFQCSAIREFVTPVDPTDYILTDNALRSQTTFTFG